MCGRGQAFSTPSLLRPFPECLHQVQPNSFWICLATIPVQHMTSAFMVHSTPLLFCPLPWEDKVTCYMMLSALDSTCVLIICFSPWFDLRTTTHQVSQIVPVSYSAPPPQLKKKRVVRVLISYFILQLRCPAGISPKGNSGCFPQGKPAATELLYPKYGACWVF